MNKRCFTCLHADLAIPCCSYILHRDENSEKHTRGKVIKTARGRKIVYPKICDKYKPRDETHATMHQVTDGRMKERKRELKEYPERDSLYAQGLTDSEIAAQLNVHPNTIGHWRRMRGLPAHEVIVNAQYDDSERQRLYDAGLTDSEMAAKLGISERTIRSWRHRKGYKPNANNEELMRKYRARQELYDQGLNDHEIGKQLGTSASTICSWRYRFNLPANVTPGRKYDDNK